MRLEFTKMHGLGNDFVVIDAISQNVMLRAEQIRRMGDRHTGIGFDQLLIVEPPSRPDAEFSYRIFNQDGNEVEHCGNGARCFALFVHQKQLTRSNPIKVATMNGLLELKILPDQTVRVDMGQPRVNAEQIPVTGLTGDAPLHDLGVADLKGSLVNVGNPHVVIPVDSTDAIDIETLGPAVQNSGLFPEGVNVGFLQVLSPTEGKLRVYERGVGETLACGTGACAAMVAGVRNGWFGDSVQLRLTRGSLTLEYRDGESIFMTGPGEFVFEGSARL
jgi:diaminopimelate epimerase